MATVNRAAPRARRQVPSRKPCCHKPRSAAQLARCPKCRKPLSAPLGAAILAAGPL